MSEINQEADAWRAIAEQTQRNCTFYQDLLGRLGDKLRPESCVSDDGSVQLEPLALKTVDLLEKMIDDRVAIGRDVDEAINNLAGARLLMESVMDEVRDVVNHKLRPALAAIITARDSSLSNAGNLEINTAALLLNDAISAFGVPDERLHPSPVQP